MKIQSKPADIHLNPSFIRNNNPAPRFPNDENHNGGRSTSAHFSGRDTKRLEEKFLTSSLQSRIKRSIPPSSPSGPSLPQSSIHEDEINDFLVTYGNQIQLEPFAHQKSTCPGAAHGLHSSVPPGYQSWEAFLTSDGPGNTAIPDPKRELEGILQDRTVELLIKELIPVPGNCSANTAMTYATYCQLLTSDLNSASDRETAISKFRKFKDNIDSTYGALLYKKHLYLEAICEKMREALRAVRYGVPNRWLDETCWNFTADSQLWNQRWTDVHLPRALEAISHVSLNIKDNVLIRLRNKYLQQGMHSLRSYLGIKGWQPYPVSRAEDIPLPVVPAVRRDVTSASQS